MASSKSPKKNISKSSVKARTIYNAISKHFSYSHAVALLLFVVMFFGYVYMERSSLTKNIRIGGLDSATSTEEALPPQDSAAIYYVRMKIVINKGDEEQEVILEVNPAWSPLGSARFKELVLYNFYDECRFFRVIPKFMAQIGINGDPNKHKQWQQKIQDDPEGVLSNKRGLVSFATSGPNTRTTQIFFNYADNSYLDKQHFTPFARVIKGMDVLDAVFAGDREAPSQGRLAAEGNTYLATAFPRLSYIKSSELLKHYKPGLVVARARE